MEIFALRKLRLIARNKILGKHIGIVHLKIIVKLINLKCRFIRCRKKRTELLSERIVIGNIILHRFGNIYLSYLVDTFSDILVCTRKVSTACILS